MFNIGGGELIVILLIALIVLGPQRLPDAARQLGKAMGDLRRLSTGFQNEMKQALETADEPGRVAPRRKVLGTEAPSSSDDAVADSIAAVSAQDAMPAVAPTSPPPPARASSKKAAQAPSRTTPRPADGDAHPVEPEPNASAKPSGSTRPPTAGERTEAPPRRTDG
jgi:Tat protein translocase TatB subunit